MKALIPLLLLASCLPQDDSNTIPTDIPIVTNTTNRFTVSEIETNTISIYHIKDNVTNAEYMIANTRYKDTYCSPILQIAGYIK